MLANLGERRSRLVQAPDLSKFCFGPGSFQVRFNLPSLNRLQDEICRRRLSVKSNLSIAIQFPHNISGCHPAHSAHDVDALTRPHRHPGGESSLLEVAEKLIQQPA